MQLSISEIAWQPEEDGAAQALLRRYGVQALELAPTRRFPRLDVVSAEQARQWRLELEAAGLAPRAMQALLFGQPDLVLFQGAEPRAAMLDYLKRVVDLAALLGVGPMVFGSPKNRLRGALEDAAAMDIAVPFFRELGDYAAARGCTIGMEANPRDYGCDFLTSSRAVAAFTAAVDSPGCRVHFDTGCVILNGEEALPLLEELAPQICHYHVSQPFLEDFSSCVYPHRGAAAVLRAAGYRGLVSIEMKRSPRGLEAVEEALVFTREAYGE